MNPLQVVTPKIMLNYFTVDSCGTAMAKNTANSIKSGVFPTTHWTNVAALREAPQSERNLMLAEFLDVYKEAFRLHLVCGLGIRIEQDVEDVLQGFITDKFIAKDILEYVNKDKGRLRDYLRKSLENYVHSMHRTKSDKAWDRRESQSHHYDNLETASQNVCPFDVAWARSVMVEAVLRTKDQFHYGKRPHVWHVLDLRQLRPIFFGTAPMDYAELSEMLELDVKVIQNCRVTALRALDKHLREVVSEYVGEDSQVIQEEMQLLNTVLKTAGVLGHFDDDLLDS